MELINANLFFFFVGVGVDDKINKKSKIHTIFKIIPRWKTTNVPFLFSKVIQVSIIQWQEILHGKDWDRASRFLGTTMVTLFLLTNVYSKKFFLDICRAMKDKFSS